MPAATVNGYTDGVSAAQATKVSYFVDPKSSLNCLNASRLGGNAQPEQLCNASCPSLLLPAAVCLATPPAADPHSPPLPPCCSTVRSDHRVKQTTPSTHRRSARLAHQASPLTAASHHKIATPFFHFPPPHPPLPPSPSPPFHTHYSPTPHLPPFHPHTHLHYPLPSNCNPPPASAIPITHPPYPIPHLPSPPSVIPHPPSAILYLPPPICHPSPIRHPPPAIPHPPSLIPHPNPPHSLAMTVGRRALCNEQ
ncbi:unnamed protein product [Closterium sp. NIES-54]